MSLKCGIVGLPNVGKSTLFNALTQTASAQAANYPFCTIEPNIGKVNVPDERLEKLAKVAGSAQIIPAQIEFVDTTKCKRISRRINGTDDCVSDRGHKRTSWRIEISAISSGIHNGAVANKGFRGFVQYRNTQRDTVDSSGERTNIR